jgi:hypothetical protein
MSVPDAVNRGLTFFAVAVLAMLATSAFHGLQVARDWAAALAQLAFVAIAVGAAAWYLWGQNRYRRSLTPLVFLGLALASKLISIWLTSGRLVLGGPDFALAALLLETIGIFGWQLYTTRDSTTLRRASTKGSQHFAQGKELES